MSPTELHARLQELAEPSYREFAARLLPEGTDLLGVRLPALRKLARHIASGSGWPQHLKMPAGCMEEELVHAFLPGYIRGLSGKQRLALIAPLIPRWNNWSLCDSASATYSFVRREREPVWKWLQPFLADKQEYIARFAVVMLLQHFSREAVWLPRIADALQRVPENGYYTDMAVAWCACELILRHAEASTLLEPGILPPRRLALTRKKLAESRRKRP